MTKEELMMRAVNGKLIDEAAYDLLVKELTAVIKTKANSDHAHNADVITDGTTKSIPTKAKQAEWDKKVTTEQLNAAVNAFASGLAWKGVHTTLAALKSAIPEPKEGYFVIVTQEPTYQNKNTLLIYEAETVNAWQTVGELIMPGKATQSADGLMSKEDKKKLDGIEEGANKYVHPSSHPATIITEDDDHKFVTATEKANIATALSTANAAKEAAATADGKAAAAQNAANTAKSTADNALSKANTNEKSIETANGKIIALEGKFVYLTTEEAQAIINKYKA